MKVLIVGPWIWPQYEKAFASGLRAGGVEVDAVATTEYFSGFMGRFQKALAIPGLALWQLNRAVITKAQKGNPDLVLFWRPTHILPSTVKQLGEMGVRTASYNNDDPFGPKTHGNVPWHHHFLWFWYLRCLPIFDRNFFYRKVNCDEALELGVKHAALLLPYFMPWRDRPVALDASERARFEAEVVFVGHYEPDGRELSIRALIQAGIKVKLWGGHYWSRTVLGDCYDRLGPITPALGDNYTKALCGGMICLAFLSKYNRDTYTRRCFEIPACGKVMLAERTDDLMSFFKEDEEACFFSSNEELVQKASWLIQHPVEREKIAAAGMRRVWANGGDVNSRATQFIAIIRAS